MPIRLGLLMALAWASSGCDFLRSENRTAGNGGGIEAVGITGVALLPDGNPAVNASVVLRQKDYLLPENAPTPKRDASSPADTGKTRAETRTDSRGYFAIDSVEPGSYRLEISIDSALGLTLEPTLVKGVSQRIDIKGKLQPVAALTGTLVSGGKILAGAYVAVYGTDKAARCDAQGRFTFRNLPPGEFSLAARYKRPLGRIVTGDFSGIVILPGVTGKQLDTLRLSTACGDYACDSLIVRSFLDLNGKQAVKVEDAALLNAGSGRVSELRLENLGLASLSAELADLVDLSQLHLEGNGIKGLPPEFSSLKSLRYLSLASNQLDSLPAAVAGYRGLQWLILDNNNLKALPAWLGTLDSLKYLVLEKNQLPSLPKEIAHLKVLRQLILKTNLLAALPDEMMGLKELYSVDVNANKLCNPSAAQSAWLDRVAPGWSKAQDCR